MTLKSDKSTAFLALALDDKQPTGNKPSLLDIDLWRRGKLNKKRSAEVKSFVARDSECYQLWMDLLGAEKMLLAEKQQQKNKAKLSVSDWLASINPLKFGGGLVFATTACLIAVVGIKSLINPSLMNGIDSDYARFSGDPMATHWYYQSNDKSFNFKPPTPYDRLKPIILVGLYTGLSDLQQSGQLPKTEQWNEVIAAYPTETKPCLEGGTQQSCQQQQALLKNFGRNLALLQLNCSQPDVQRSDDDYNTQQKRLAEFKEQMAADEDLSPLTQMLVQWKQTTDNNAFCGQVKRLLNQVDG